MTNLLLSLSLILLGTGYPRPHPEHAGPATAIIAGDEWFVVDAGRGLTMRVAATSKAMEQGVVQVGEIERVSRELDAALAGPAGELLSITEFVFDCDHLHNPKTRRAVVSRSSRRPCRHKFIYHQANA